MANQLVMPTAQRLVTYTRQDDNVPRDARISVAVNPPDEAATKGVIWLDENKLSVTIDEAGILALLNEELTDYAAHRASAVFHDPADTANVVDPTPATTIVVAKIRANLLKAALRAHMLNTGGSYHDITDTVNEAALGLVPDATDVNSLRTLVIGIKTYYEAHRVEPGVHPTDDTTNTITTADPEVLTVEGPIAITNYPDVQRFTVSGTWTKPATVTWVEVLLIGPGGGGGSGPRRSSAVDTCGGAGGGGGGRTHRTLRASLLSSTHAITIGAAGAGGAVISADDTDGASGSAATATTFGSLLQATGGAGGGAGGTGGNTGGAGGLGDIVGGTGAAGVVGAAGNAGGNSSGPGAGGAGGGINSVGPAEFAGGNNGLNSGTQAVATGTAVDGPGHGGEGGRSRTAIAASAGDPGGAYGGGGGGGGASVNGNNSGAGGSGGAGYCLIVSY